MSQVCTKSGCIHVRGDGPGAAFEVHHVCGQESVLVELDEDVHALLVFGCGVVPQREAARQEGWLAQHRPPVLIFRHLDDVGDQDVV